MNETGKVYGIGGDENFDPRANMYGCLPCPKCGSEYRTPMQNGQIECSDCQFTEPILNPEAFE